MIRLIAIVPLCVLALTAVFRVPHGALWKPAVGATEWGHALAAIALVLAVPWGRDRVQLGASAMALGAAVLLLTPLARATRVDPDAELRRAFGGVPRGERAPLSLRGLLGAGVPVGPVRTETLAGDRRVDLYGVRPGERRPFVVAIHGGSWNSGDRTQLPEVYHWFAAHGFVVAAIEYRLAPASPFPAQRDDVRAAIAWVRERADLLGVDPDRAVLYGRSAGGHLALLTAYEDGGVRAVVGLYPPTDLHWSWEHPTRRQVVDTPKTLSEFLGGPRDAVPERYTAATPMTFVRPGSPPTLLVHGGRDELVFPEQSERLAASLDRAGVPRVVLALPWATHGCEANLAGPSGQLFLYTLERFLTGVGLP